MSPVLGVAAHASSHAPGGSDALSALTSAVFAAGSIDGTAGTASLRTLGTGSAQAAAGNDSRFTGNAIYDATMVVPLAFVGIGVPTTGAAIGASANTMRACRVRIPKTGTLVDLYVFITTSSGNLIGAVFDTGQAGVAGDHTQRSRLWTGSSTASAANWLKLGDPNLAVVAGQHLDLAVVADNTTVAILRQNAAAAAFNQLPANFLPPDGAGAVLTKLAWSQVQGSFAAPSVVTEANAATGTIVPLIVARIS